MNINGISDDIDLSSGHLINKELKEVDLSTFQFLNFSMDNARFEKSFLDNCTFDNSMMENSEIYQSDGKSMKFYGLKMMNFTIKYSNVIRTSFEEIKADHFNLQKSMAHHITIKNCVLSNGSFIDNEMFGAVFEKTVFIKVNFVSDELQNFYGLKKSVFDSCVFIDCNFNNINLSESKFDRVLMVKCRFVNADMNETQAFNMNLLECKVV